MSALSKKIIWVAVTIVLASVVFLFVFLTKSRQPEISHSGEMEATESWTMEDEYESDLYSFDDLEDTEDWKAGVQYAGNLYYSDGMEAAEGWVVGGELGTDSRLSVVSGKEGKAIEIDYGFISGNWIQMQKDVSFLNIENAGYLKFYYKGGGSVNTLQIKLVDSAGVTFGIDFNGATDTENTWKQLKVPIDDLQYFWGGGGENNDLDKANIRQIFFAITREAGGRGTVTIDEVRFVE